MSKPVSTEQLKRTARRLRLRILRMVHEAPGGHLGGSFSVLDILVALYFNILRHRPDEPDWPDRDRLILSKGHCCMALYTALCEAGYFREELLDNYCRNGGVLGGHPKRGSAPGVELSTGSLGHGLPVGNGIALANRMDGRDNRIFIVLSDGELQEGSTWEGIMLAAQQGLDHLVAVVDFNKLVSLGRTESIISLEPLGERFYTFGWGVRRVDGHDFPQLLDALDNLPAEPGKPTVVIADTVKGKGVSFMEGVPMWHHRKLKDEEYEKARRELSA